MNALDAQLELDRWAPGSRPPRAHAADATSAHAAADRLEISGRGENGMQLVLEALRKSPGLTSRELARVYGFDRHDTAKRLSDLFRRHVVERVEPADGDLVWYPADTSPAPRTASAVERHRASNFAASLSWETAIARARAGFRRARRKPSTSDLEGAAAIERRLHQVYMGKLVARVFRDGRIEVTTPGAAATHAPDDNREGS